MTNFIYWIRNVTTNKIRILVHVCTKKINQVEISQIVTRVIAQIIQIRTIISITVKEKHNIQARQKFI